MTIILGLLALSFLVFFHETGHFLCARLCKVEVEAFSIGMGPVLLHHKWGKTDYRISLIPVGGYCAMKGEKDFQKALDEGLPYIQGEKDSFYGCHPLKRILIAFAGPFFNLLFAFICMTIISLAGYKYETYGTKVLMADQVFENTSSAAHEAGLENNDQIIEIDGEAVNDFSQIISIISAKPEKDIAIKVLRDGQNLDFIVHSELDKESGSGKIGIVADTSSVLKQEVKGLSFFPAIAKGFYETGRYLVLTVKSIGILFKGINFTSAVAGPARITTILGNTIKSGFSESLRSGLVSTLELMAVISISLFLTNLLPVPVLDGGLIIFALIEFISGKKMKAKLLYHIQAAGIVFIILLFILALSSDFLYFIKK